MNLRKDQKMYARYFSYAQGLPLVIVMITAIVDARTREVIDDVTDDAYLPNMGVYDCFLGDQKRDPKPSYFSTAKFLYFQMQKRRKNYSVRNSISSYTSS